LASYAKTKNMFTPKITKEEINLLPATHFEGKISVIDDNLKIKPAIENLRKHSVVGIDTETKPCFQKGRYNKMALIQIATLEQCFLFQLQHIDFSDDLVDFFADKNIRKVGLALKNDISGLSKLNKLNKFKPKNVLDLQSVIKNYGIMELGLQKIYAILFGQKISKSQQLSNWENSELTELQQRYAATDAWACLKIYLRILEEKPLSIKEMDNLILE